MARQTVYICDVCGTTKKDSNHWWDLFIEVTSGDEAETSHLEIHSMDPEAEDDHVVACGEVCVIKLVSRFLSTGQLTIGEVQKQ